MNYKLNLEKSPVDERDWIAENFYSASYSTPDTFTLVPDLPPVRDQGPYGTCAAQVASCMKEWQEKQDVDYSDYMSPQFIYNNRSNPAEEGMYPRDVMSILKNTGICSESSYPYESNAVISDSVYEEASQYVISSYAAVTTIEGLKQALVSSGPCFIGFPVYNTGTRFWYADEGDVYLGGHAVTVVGYTDVGFILRNSWGADWGDSGYTIFPYEDWGSQWEIWTTIDADTIINDQGSEWEVIEPEIVVPVEPETEPDVIIPDEPVVPITPTKKGRKKSFDPRGRRKNTKLFRKITIIHRSE